MFYNLETNERLSLGGQSFSGTDKNRTGESKGVVFPLACDESVKDRLNISSIIDHHNDDVALVKHTEARIANADVANNEVNYVETRCVAVEYNLTQNSFTELLDIKNISVYEANTMILERLREKIYEYINVVSNEALRPFFCVDSECITEKKYSYSTDFSFPEIKRYNYQPLDSTHTKVIDEILNEFADYMEEISKTDKKKLDNIISAGLNAYFGDCDKDKLLSAKVLGKDIYNKLKKEKELMKADNAKETLASEVIDIITSYDVGLLQTR